MNTHTTVVTSPCNIKDIMASVSGNSFIRLDTTTIPKLTGGQKNAMQGKITKTTTGSNVMVYQNKHTNAYENAVNKRLEKEGKDPSNFTLQDRKWGTRVPNMPLVEHKGSLYLEVIFLHSGTVSYQLDGDTIEKSAIVGLAEKKEGKQGGLSDKVVIRDFKVSSINAIQIDKVLYTNIVQ